MGSYLDDITMEGVQTTTAQSDTRSLNEKEDIYVRLNKLDALVETLLDRTDSGEGGINFGGVNFRSTSEASHWIRDNVKGFRFGYFVDGVSLWQFFFQDHQETDDVMGSYYAASRVGYKQTHESKILASFNNVLPTLLGKGSDNTCFLPGLATHAKWESNDGFTGLKYRITRELPLAQAQVTRAFARLEANGNARALAHECLIHSVRFISELAAYITRAYAELINSNSFTKDQSWSLVCRCVKRCFTDLSGARITGKDIHDESTPLYTATEVLWATLKTHQVMRDYLDKNFEDHPAFASVITRFITNNSFNTNISGLTSKVSGYDKKFDNLSKSLDKLFTRVDKLENP